MPLRCVADSQFPDYSGAGASWRLSMETPLRSGGVTAPTRFPCVRQLDTVRRSTLLRWKEWTLRPLNLDLSDRQAISDLFAAYSWAIDTGAGGQLADLFLPDGKFERSDGTTIQGRMELASFGEQVFKSRPHRLQHITSNSVPAVDESGNVRVRSYVHIYAGEPAGSRLLGMGAYDDSVVKMAGEWKFRSRRFESWGSPLQ